VLRGAVSRRRERSLDGNDLRGEGADLGEGLAAAGKQEAAAHDNNGSSGSVDVTATRQSSAWTGLPERSSSSSHSGAQVHVHSTGSSASPAATRRRRSSARRRRAASARFVDLYQPGVGTAFVTAYCLD
jgi:hypothetical protein